jgi:3-hydroxyacyl-CoA dehydrogenase
MNLNDIKKIVVIGAGTMGHSIAQVYAQFGYEVALVDVNQQTLDKAINKIKSNLNTLVEWGRLKQEDISKVTDRIHISQNLKNETKDTDLVG